VEIDTDSLVMVIVVRRSTMRPFAVLAVAAALATRRVLVRMQTLRAEAGPLPELGDPVPGALTLVVATDLGMSAFPGKNRDPDRGWLACRES